MAFRTNKVPAIEERTVSGSSVSFNSAFALPLKACKVSFSATQAGSGEPSPSNPRAISGVSAIGLTANSTPVSVSLGEERFGGELDVLTGILTLTHKRVLIKDVTWSYVATSPVYFVAYPFTQFDDLAIGAENAICECYKTSSSGYYQSIQNLEILTNREQSRIYIKDNNYTSQAQLYESVGDYAIVYKLKTPITIQLSANELSSIIGNNTFSTDTGTLEITFADLQEKSASGSVASFNTALAMPLASCNIAVNAWQEGSGDPSPSNVRAIHDYSEVNATRAGKNLLKKDNFIILYTPYSEMTFSKATFLKKGTYTISLSNVVNSTRWRYAFRLFDKNGNIFTNAITNGKVSFSLTLSDTADDNTACVSTSNIYATSCVITIYEDCYITCALCFGNISSATTCDTQLEAGSTATAYEPYVTPTIYTIQLGQEVYGAEVDVVNGVARITHEYILLDEDYPNITLYNISNKHGIAFGSALSQTSTRVSGLTNMGMVITASTTSGGSFWLGVNSKTVYWLDIMDTLGLTTIDEFKAWLADNNLQVVASLPTPIEVQLTPTQIETLIGNNTIFADTGDIDLTYKDLDIAKRGNFREVFKLPS